MVLLIAASTPLEATAGITASQASVFSSTLSPSSANQPFSSPIIEIIVSWNGENSEPDGGDTFSAGFGIVGRILRRRWRDWLQET